MTTETEIAQIERSRYNYTGRVLRVIDGDTLVADLDLGFDMHARVHLRIAGINTPELHDADADVRARAYAARLELQAIAPENEKLYVRTYRDRMTFQRYVADVYVDRGWGVIDIAAHMVERGYAERVR